MSAGVHYSRGAKTEDNTPAQRFAEGFAQFRDLCLSDQAATKGRQWIAAPCGEAPDDELHQTGGSEGSFRRAIGKPHRCMACVRPRRFISLDLDRVEGRDALDDLQAWIEAQHFSAFGWTTHSHTPDKIRARFIVETDRLMGRDECMRASAALRGRINAALGGAEARDRFGFDSTLDRPEQPIYLPPKVGERFTFDGVPVAVDDLLADAPEEQSGAEAGAAVQGFDNGAIVEIDRHRYLLKRALLLAGSIRSGTLTRDEALLVLKSERDAGKYSRDVPDDEIRRALDGAIAKGGTPRGERRAAENGAEQSRLSGLWVPNELDRFTFDELTSEPDPTRYTIFPYLPAGISGVLVGAGGTSKTGVMTLMGVHICTGSPLFGGSVERGKVLFVTAEDRRDVLRKHVWAHARDLPPILRQRVAENFIVADVVGLGFKLTRSINGQTVVAPDVDGLIEFSKALPDLRLVVFDTLSRLNGGEETNEDLARVIEAMEAVSRATGAATLIAHHTGKVQAREAIADQYSSRGASSLSDNARSVMLVQVVGAKDKEAPTNAGELISNKTLLRFTHVKANDIAAGPKYLHRVPTKHRAQLVPFSAEFASGGSNAAAWQRLAEWLSHQTEVPYPTLRTMEGLGDEYGSRSQVRAAVHWAMDRGLIVEAPHPNPKGARKVYLALPDEGVRGAMAVAA